MTTAANTIRLSALETKKLKRTFSAGLGLASIVPSVLMLNTKFWCWYPFDYPFYMLMTEYGRVAPEIYDSHIQLIPLLPAGIGITIVCLALACLRYGAAGRHD